MAFTQGNQLWQLRHKDGRDLLFSSPELLWEAAKEYFQWCDDHPMEEDDWVGGFATKVQRKKKRPYLISGLAVYLDASESWWRNFKARVTDNAEFLTVISRIEDIIRTNKFEGAIVGHYNANIISRDLGLVDKKDVTVGEKPKPDWMEDAIPNE